MKTVDKTQLKANLLELLQIVELQGEEILVTEGTKPVARISPYQKSYSTAELFKNMQAKEACEQMEQQKNGLVPSTAIWEIAIKVNNRKLDLGVNIDDYIATLKKSDVVRIIPINEEIWLDSVRLKWEHRDPVDRVVVAITQRDKANVITADQKIASFYSSVIW